jgi:ribosome-associated toxin RatA of RatAB toxin-antitoxin module
MIFQSFLPKVTKRHVEHKVLQTPANHLFRIIQDVDRYAEFLPLCSYSKVDRRFGHDFEATLTVGLPPLFTETYRSKVTVNPQHYIVETQSLKGKYFDQLSSRWQLYPILEGLRTNTSEDNNAAQSTTRALPAQKCKVDFCVEITATDPLVVSTLDQVLQKIAGDQVRAFEKRCRQIPWDDDGNHENSTTILKTQ